MRRTAALALVLGLAACGGHGNRGLKPTVSNPVQPAKLVVKISAPTHHPKVNVKWPVTITATNGTGQAVRGTVTMQILFNGNPQGKVDNGKVYRFVGTWREKPGQEITWPKQSSGVPLEFEAIVKALHATVKKTYAVTPQ
jgi:hypothetical protein